MVEDQIALLRKVKDETYERSDGQYALAIVSRYTEMYRESFPKAKDVTIDDLIPFAQNRANVLKNKLTKVKKLPYAPRMDLAFSAIKDYLKAMETSKSEVERLEAILKARPESELIQRELEEARRKLQLMKETYDGLKRESEIVRKAGRSNLARGFKRW